MGCRYSFYDVAHVQSYDRQCSRHHSWTAVAATTPTTTVGIRVSLLSHSLERAETFAEAPEGIITIKGCTCLVC